MKTTQKKDKVKAHKKQSPTKDKAETGDDPVEMSQEEKPETTESADKNAAAEVAETPPADDRLIRLQADFDNFRKRMIREKADVYRRANEDIMEELLPVLDHLKLALEAVGDSDAHDSIAQGFKLVGEQLLTVLKKFGLSPIETDGVPFDPNVHEAVLHMPSEDVPENEIVSQTRAGYMLGGQVLRAAQVVVSSGSPEAEAEDAASENDA